VLAEQLFISHQIDPGWIPLKVFDTLRFWDLIESSYRPHEMVADHHSSKTIIYCHFVWVGGTGIRLVPDDSAN